MTTASTQPTEGTLQLAGASLHWLSFEPAAAEPLPGEPFPTLVFLHYFGGSARTWLPVTRELAAEFRCVAVDLRGFGDSTVAETGDPAWLYSVKLMADDVGAIIRYLRLPRYFLVGHSMGGKVAVRLAADAGCPPGLAGIILLAPSPPSPETMPAPERVRLLEGWGAEQEARKTLAKTTAASLPEDLAAATVADSLRSSAGAWRAWLENGSRENLSEHVRLIHVPVTLAAGEKDKNITEALLRREIAERLPDALPEVAVVRGAAHLLPLEAPVAVANLIRKAVGGSGEGL